MTDREPTEKPAPERRTVERRRFGSHTGIRVDRRTPADRRDEAPAEAPSESKANRRRGEDRRSKDAEHALDRRTKNRRTAGRKKTEGSNKTD